MATAKKKAPAKKAPAKKAPAKKGAAKKATESKKMAKKDDAVTKEQAETTVPELHPLIAAAIDAKTDAKVANLRTEIKDSISELREMIIIQNGKIDRLSADVAILSDPDTGLRAQILRDVDSRLKGLKIWVLLIVGGMISAATVTIIKMLSPLIGH